MGGLWSVSCCAYLVDCSSFECFMYFRSTVNVPSPSLLFKSEIQMTCLVVCCFVFFFCFVLFVLEVLFPTQVSSLPSLLHWGKKISFVRITAHIYGEISESLE